MAVRTAYVVHVCSVACEKIISKLTWRPLERPLPKGTGTVTGDTPLPPGETPLPSIGATPLPSIGGAPLPSPRVTPLPPITTGALAEDEKLLKNK